MSADEMTTTPSSINDLQPRMKLSGTVKRIELYGAFVDIGIGRDALLHISQLGKPNVRNVEDVVKEGETITVYVLKVDKQENKVAVSMEQPPSVTWDEMKEGDVVRGTIIRLENFGAFVDIGAERPGMVHVSELATGFVKAPGDVVSVGEEVEVRIIRINRKKRQIDLSMKLNEPVVEILPDEDEEEVPTAMELALRRAMEQQERNSNKRDRRKNRRTDEQDDIIQRTLRNHSSR